MTKRWFIKSPRSVILFFVLTVLLLAMAASRTFYAGQNVKAAARAVISPDRYRQAVTDLSTVSMGGRRVGTPGSLRAIECIRSTFEAIGLQPGASNGTFLQKYEHRYEGRAKAANVIGVLPGTHPELGKEAVVVTAHHDHLGSSVHDGCPNEPNGKCLKPGANDNATGVAALFELAHALSVAREQVNRTVIFMTTDGEECGCTGSNYYVFKNPVHSLAQTAYVLNIDQIGQGGELVIHEPDKGHSFGENCDVDAEVFARMSVPAESLIGDNSEYHRCTDTVATINFKKAIKTVHRAFDLVWKAAVENDRTHSTSARAKRAQRH